MLGRGRDPITSFDKFWYVIFVDHFIKYIWPTLHSSISPTRIHNFTPTHTTPNSISLDVVNSQNSPPHYSHNTKTLNTPRGSHFSTSTNILHDNSHTIAPFTLKCFFLKLPCYDLGMHPYLHRYVLPPLFHLMHLLLQNLKTRLLLTPKIRFLTKKIILLQSHISTKTWTHFLHLSSETFSLALCHEWWIWCSYVQSNLGISFPL